MNNNENTTVDNCNDVLGNKEIANNYTGAIWNLLKNDVNNVYLRRIMYTLSFDREIRKNPHDSYYNISVILNEINKGVNSSIFGRNYRICPNRIGFFGFYERSDIKLNDHVHYFIQIPKDFNNPRRIRFITNKIKYFTKVLITNKYWEYSNYSFNVKKVEDSNNVLLRYMSKKYNKNTNDNLIVC